MIQHTTIEMLERVLAALGARYDHRVLWQGEQLDRLLDARHADLVEVSIRLLRAEGWQVALEVTYSIGRERGSIDVLAWHPDSSALLVVEVKSVVPDIQAMLAALDRKMRVARAVARGRGWQPGAVSAVLVLPDDRTSRRRVSWHRSTFDTVLPARTVAVRRWVRKPEASIAGVWFLPRTTAGGGRHRVSRRLDSVERDPVTQS